MKNAFKKLVSLTAIIAVLTVPIFAFESAAAQEEIFEYEAQDGEVTITSCDETAAGDVEIPAFFEDLPVTAIADGAFENCFLLESVTIPDSVVTIGERAFSYIGSDSEYYNLDNLIIRCSEDSYAEAYAEANGFKFTFIETDEENPYLYYILNSEVTLTGYKGELDDTLFIPKEIGGYPVISIAGYAFEGNADIKSLLLPETLKSIGPCAFKGCESLEEVAVTASVETIGNFAFAGCNALKAYKVDSDSQSFRGDSLGALYNKDQTELISCPAGIESQTFTVPDSVTDIGEYAFSQCINLVEITLPESVKSIGTKAFENCAAVTEFTLPDSVESVSDFAFVGCVTLENLIVGSSVKSIGYEILDNCTALKNVYYNGTSEQWEEVSVDEVNTVLLSAQLHFIGAVQNALRYLEYTVNGEEVTVNKCDPSARGALEIPSEIDGLPVTIIAYNAFLGCKGITEITLPESLETVEMMSFKECSSLETVCMFPGVKSIGSYAFDGCIALKRVVYYGMKDQLVGLKAAIGENNGEFLSSSVSTFGDINGDSKTNSSDALSILQVATGHKTIDYKQHKLADVNFDTKINSSDALLILKYATGIIDSFEKPAA